MRHGFLLRCSAIFFGVVFVAAFSGGAAIAQGYRACTRRLHPAH